MGKSVLVIQGLLKKTEYVKVSNTLAGSMGLFAIIHACRNSWLFLMAQGLILLISKHLGKLK